MDRQQLVSLIKGFLAEDIGQGDITSTPIFDADQTATARFIAKETFVCCGMEKVAATVFTTRNKAIVCRDAMDDGKTVQPGDILLRIAGPVLDLLAAERVALNLTQRLCGIATLTRRHVDALAGLPVRVVDTRKTTPGLRMLEKYAVRVGGGRNHRFNLADGVLIKDNHIAACGSISRAVERVRALAPHTVKIEVETETLDQVRECLDCGVEIIMLDNMEPATMRQAVGLVAGRSLVEASGGVTLENIRAIGETGVDLISVGRLTHSAPACDISMEIVIES